MSDRPAVRRYRPPRRPATSKVIPFCVATPRPLGCPRLKSPSAVYAVRPRWRFSGGAPSVNATRPLILTDGCSATTTFVTSVAPTLTLARPDNAEGWPYLTWYESPGAPRDE